MVYLKALRKSELTLFKFEQVLTPPARLLASSLRESSYVNATVKNQALFV